VHINSAQLGVEEGITMGWCWKSHPALGYRDKMKYCLKLTDGKAHEDTSYALFTKNIRYIHKSDGAKLSTTGIALRIAKRPCFSEQLFRKELAQRWSNLSIKNGESLAIKFFILFGKESTLGDFKMTHIIEQQNLYLRTTKQRIVRNLNDIDDEINFETHHDVNMEGSGTTIREMFNQRETQAHRDRQGAQKHIFSQQKIKHDVIEMTDLFTKMSGDMVNLRKYLYDLSESVGRKMKELKEMTSSLINSSTLPSRGL
jgi:hypothetical protein